MSNDIGSYGPDANDTAPASPLAALDGLNTTATRERKPKTLQRLPDFDPELGVDRQIHKQEGKFQGTIMNNDNPLVDGTKTYYEVQLQNGQFVQAYHPGQTVSDFWDDFQTVNLSFNGIDYVITSIPRRKELHLWWEAIDALLPGGTARGRILRYDDDAEEFEETDGIVSITDSEHKNCVLVGGRIQVRINDVSYEPIGENGLIRQAKTIAIINPNNSGTVRIYQDRQLAKTPDPEDEGEEINIEVTAHLAWGHGNKPFNANKEIFITYFPDEEKWIITGGEC